MDSRSIESLLPLEPSELHSALWSIAHSMPSLQHPWFRSIIDKKLTKDGVIAGERQHFLRVMRNVDFFSAILENARREGDTEIEELAQQNFSEECEGDENHTDLLFQFFDELSMSREEIERTLPTPGTAVAIESIVGFCQNHSALEGMAFVSFVEAQNAGQEGVAYQVYRSLVDHYGFSKRGAETFLVHSEEDAEHGPRQIDLICKKANTLELQKKVVQAVRTGVATFSIEWDGHFQAATRKIEYWGGLSS